MSKPGHPVLVTGATTEPAFNGVPVNMSSDDKELVMEYSGNWILMAPLEQELFLEMVWFPIKVFMKTAKATIRFHYLSPLR